MKFRKKPVVIEAFQSENKVAGYYLFPNEEFMVVIEEEEE